MEDFKEFDAGKGNLHTVGNYSFHWTKDHLTKEETNHLRFQYDELGAAVVNKLQEIHQREQEVRKQNGEPPVKLDMYEALKANKDHDEILSKFWTEVNTVPDFVDWEQLERGQRFFYRYALGNLLGFAFQGFVGENSASSSVVEVLLRTGGFSTRALRRRLLETFQFVLEVTHSLPYVQPGGKAHVSTIRVRMLHSLVQQRILRVAQTKGPSYFDASVHGTPINTLDSIHAICTFGCNHAWLQLPFMGIRPSPGEIADYIALWRYIAHVIGTPTEYFSTPAQAKAVMESLSFNELSITPSSVVAGHNFVEAIKDLPPVMVSGAFIEAGSRWLNGNAICDQLGMGKPGYYAYACFQGHCWLASSLATVQRWIPAFEKWSIDFHRDVLHTAIIHSKAGLQGGSKLHFTHVPDGRITGKENNDRPELAKLRFYQRPLELLYFAVFCLGCFVMLGLAAVAVRMGMLISTRIW